MRTAYRLVQNYFYSFVYALGITIGIYISIEELHRFNNTRRFYIFSILIFLIIFFENIIAILRRHGSIEINLDLNDEVNEIWHFFYKFLLPFIYYLCLVAFGFYNLNSISITGILFLTFITFFLLFVNTKAFFQNIKKLESRTHYVYDLIKFLIFFTLVNTFSHWQMQNPQFLPLSAIGVGIVAFALILLMAWRVNKVQLKTYLISGFTSFLLAVLFGALSFGNSFNPIQIALGLILAFYLSVAIIHHILLNTLTKSIIFEYIVILLVIFSVIYGIT